MSLINILTLSGLMAALVVTGICHGPPWLAKTEPEAGQLKMKSPHDAGFL